jgi:hypothetical protein
VDTIAAQPAPIAKAPEKKTPADASANFDTIQNIKSQFLVKRAQKAIAEKKENTAEPCQVCFPFIPDQIIGHEIRGDAVFFLVKKPATMYLPCFAADTGFFIGLISGGL